MTESFVVQTKRVGVASALLAAILFVMVIGSAPKASASIFCEASYLAPYGSGGDRCYGPSNKGLDWAGVVTQERAGCVAILDGANNFLTSWVCGGAGSTPATAASVSYGGGFLTNQKGIIRSNNQSFSAWFRGQQACFAEGC